MTPTGLLLFALSIAVKASFILAIAFIVTRLMRSRPAAERHLVWMLASICVLALPLLTFGVPVWRVGVHSDALTRLTGRWTAHERIVVPEAVHGSHATGHAVEIVVTPRPAAAPVPPAPVRARGGTAIRVEPVRALPAAPVAPAIPDEPLRSTSWPLVLVLLTWLAGSLLVAGRLLAGLLRVRAIARRARPLLDPVLLVRAHGIAAAMELPRAVRYLEGDDDEMPITFGVLRPTLLLPSAAREWSGARQNAVLRHELAHIRRRDSLSQLIAELGCALYWFNPLMWWAARSLCVEREHACDDAVLAAGSRPSDYAAELLDIARTLRAQRTTALAAIAMARPNDLRSRLSALLDPRPRRERTATRLLVPAWLGAAALVIPLSSLVPELSPRLSTVVEAAAEPAPAPEAPQPVLPRNATPLKRTVEAPAAASLGALYAGAAAVCEGRLQNVSSNTNNGRRTLKWSGERCSGEVLIVGDVEFDADFTRITGISRGGELRISTTEDGTRRSLVVQPAASGVSFDYQLNGSRRELDADAQAWLSETLLFMFRRLGFMAEERARSILDRRGSAALLAETELLSSDYVRAGYLTVLIEHGQLDAGALRRVLDQAGRTIGSDYYRTKIITAVAGNYAMDDAMRTSYIDAVSGVGSDYYRHAAFSTLLEKGRLTPAQVSAVLRETRRIGSDHYRATLLQELGGVYADAPGIRQAYLDAARDIGSDHYKAQVLARLIGAGGLSAADRAAVIDAAASIGSDHYRGQILKDMAAELDDAAARAAFVRAARGIGSDHTLQMVLSAAADHRLDRDALLGVLTAAESIESDHARATLLVKIAREHRLDGETRAAFERLMRGISSRHYRSSVETALERNGR